MQLWNSIFSSKTEVGILLETRHIIQLWRRCLWADSSQCGSRYRRRNVDISISSLCLSGYFVNTYVSHLTWPSMRTCVVVVGKMNILPEKSLWIFVLQLSCVLLTLKATVTVGSPVLLNPPPPPETRAEVGYANYLGNHELWRGLDFTFQCNKLCSIVWRRQRVLYCHLLSWHYSFTEYFPHFFPMSYSYSKFYHFYSWEFFYWMHLTVCGN